MERAFATPLDLPIGGTIGVLAGEHYSIRTGDLLITKSYDYLVTSKDDGLAIAMGAFMGARNPVTIMKLLGWASQPRSFHSCTRQRIATLILYADHFPWRNSGILILAPGV